MGNPTRTDPQQRCDIPNRYAARSKFLHDQTRPRCGLPLHRSSFLGCFAHLTNLLVQSVKVNLQVDHVVACVATRECCYEIPQR